MKKFNIRRRVNLLLFVLVSSWNFAQQIDSINTETLLNTTEEYEDTNKNDEQVINEVIVVGYGTQRRRELTGAVSTVSKAVLRNVNVPSFDALLGGTVSGLTITQDSGQPGAAPSVRLRGGNSVNASNDPLYVIDGFIFYSDRSSTKTGLNNIESSLNPLSFLNPSDIESIEVLKDVSATAIYGARGANGVIMVTTKKGKRTTIPTIDYQYISGWSTSAKKLSLLDAGQWARLQKDYFNNKGGYTDEQIAQLGKGYDWQNAVLQTGLEQTHRLSVSGGDERMRYLLSGNFIDQEGVILNSGFKRYNLRLNLDRNLFKDLSVGITATAGKSIQNALTTFEETNYNDSPFSHGIANSLTYALYIPPTVPIYNADGSYNYNNPFEYAYLISPNGKTTANPVSDLKESVGRSTNISLLGNFFVKYNITPGLTAKVNIGSNLSHTTQDFFAPSYTALGLALHGIGGVGNKQYEAWQTEYTLNYTKKFRENHSFDILAGYTYERTSANSSTAFSSNFSNESIKNNGLQYGTKPHPNITETAESKWNSAIGRVNYTFLDRYHLTATFRADNSSRFAKNHRWGYFPSIGLSWNINEESFLRNVSILNYLKLRFSYGTVGNQEIADFAYKKYYSAYLYNGQIAYNLSNIGNENLKWETTTQYNAGLDFGLFENRLNAVIDVYSKNTSDLLLELPVAAVLGGGKQLYNSGNVTNKGIEFTVDYALFNTQDFKWNISANIARNENKVTRLTEGIDQLLEGSGQERILKAGEPLGSYYGLIFDGIVQNGEDVSHLPLVGSKPPQPGDIKYRDVTGDGKIDSKDRVTLGSIQPDFTYGFSMDLSYRNFELFFLFQGSKGNKVYNALRRYLEHPNDSYNLSAALLDSWTPTHPSNTVPAVLNDKTFASTLDSRYVEDASYLKLKNITLGYNYAFSVKENVPIKLKVYVSAQNLFTITHYKGYSPEVAPSDGIWAVDLGAYPSIRTFSIGVKITY
ncbi:MAG: TonB-dependent receptor [Flavobacteriaceae bacterium]|jgi:TonB-linked SusC/RagA family outer membrane protein|nr:TonB-dependent receptor [Flavobacteriaceae bacterium]